MTTFYLDFEGGTDANNGTSFAQRWKTFVTGATAARTAPGDVIRVMGSPVPTSLGQTATWVDNSDTVTLTTAVTADIDACAVAWTAAANVTQSLNTSSYKEGAQSVNLAIAAGFTTGLVAYHATGTLDLSGYQQVSFWIQTPGSNLAAGVLQLKLCSDTVGAVAIDTIDIPALTFTSWFRVTVNKGSALGSAIQSVALYAVSDPATITVLLDNIIACKATSDNASLSLNSLIAPHNVDTSPWYCINSIRGTTIKLGAWEGATPGATGNGKYFIPGVASSPSSVVATTYKREAIPVAQQLTQESGTIAARMSYIGGWNRTDMSTQDGVTWVRPSSGQVANNAGSALFTAQNGATGDHISLDKFYFACCNDEAIAGFSGALTIGEIGGAGGYALFDAVASMDTTVDELSFLTGFYTAATMGYYAKGSIDIRHAGELHCGWDDAVAASGPRPFTVSSGNALPGSVRAVVDEIKGFPYGITCLGQGLVEIFNCIFGYNTEDIYAGVSTVPGYSLIRLINPWFIAGDITFQSLGRDSVEVHGMNGNMQDQRFYRFGQSTGGRVITATDQRHTASDVSWKFIVRHSTSSIGVPEQTPIERVVGRAAVAANAQVTVTLWAYRDQSFIRGRLLVRPWLPGISINVYDDVSLNSTWEQLQVQFTPTAEGVFEVVFQAWSVSTSDGNVWIDDIDIAQ